MSIILPAIPPYYDAPHLEAAMVQELQLMLDTKIGWLQKVYPLVYTGIDSEKKSGYPQIYANDGSGTHYDLRPDSRIQSYSFFEIDKPYAIDSNNDEVTYYLSLVVWANLKILDAAKLYCFTSELIKNITNELKYYETEILNVETRPEKIFDKYSGIHQELKQFLMNPYTAFKLSFSIKEAYTNNCTPAVINSCQQNIDRINNLDTTTKNCVISALTDGCSGTINVYLNGVLKSSQVSADLSTETLNIILT